MVCLQGASAIQHVIEQSRGERLRVLVVWEPVLPTDWIAPSTASMRRLADLRVQQYWDRGRLLSKTMGEHDRSSIVGIGSAFIRVIPSGKAHLLSRYLRTDPLFVLFLGSRTR
jgi:hypothetical protein